MANKRNNIFKRRKEKFANPGIIRHKHSGNIYLNELDQYMKHKLKLKYTCRYMDDVVALVNTKEEAI